MGAAPPWGPGPPVSAASQEEASGVLGPRPLSAQARTLLDHHPHPSYHSSDSVRHTLIQPTRPSQPASPILRLRAETGGKAGLGLVYHHYLVPGGDHILTHVCKCVIYTPIYRPK